MLNSRVEKPFTAKPHKAEKVNNATIISYAVEEEEMEAEEENR